MTGRSLADRIGTYPLDREGVENYLAELQAEIKLYDDWLKGTGLPLGHVAVLVAPDGERRSPAEARRHLDSLVASGDVLTVESPDGTRIPSWQLDDDGHLIVGVRAVDEARPASVSDLTGWMLAPHPDLSGRTPRQALIDGDVADVVQAISREER